MLEKDYRGETRKIIDSSQREILKNAISMAYSSLYTPGKEEEANNINDQIAKMPGMRLIERRDFNQDIKHRCVHYVFDTVLKEPWCQVGEYMDSDFWDDALGFLQNHGYKIIGQPQNNDIVVYGDGNVNKPFSVEHFGIYRNDKVISKFSRGHIFEHPIDLVPENYGQELLFIRKKNW